ncbi:Uncharacterised protein [Gordonia bronchialis]|nr:Uncharacterised protein [Gordonia bronchialis]
MATVNNGGSVELWDTRDPARPRRAAELAIDTRYTFPLAFAPVSPGGPTSGANILATGAVNRPGFAGGSVSWFRPLLGPGSHGSW